MRHQIKMTKKVKSIIAIVLTVVLALCGVMQYNSISKAGSESKYTLYVGPSRQYKTINAALDAVGSLNRGSSERVTIMIDPGNYEEMLVIDQKNITLKNSSSNPSTALKNKGVNIDSNAVRITWYYGHGYTYYSMGSDYKYSASVLSSNKSKGKASVTNPGAGTATHWNASVVVKANGFAAENIIFENSFNQYVSEMAAKDVIEAQSGAKEGSTKRANLSVGSTKVQEKEYVERAAALAIANNVTEADFLNCKFVGRQDTLFGGSNTTAVFENCSIYGSTDYIFGGMKALFYKCKLVANTSDLTSTSIKNDKFYVTAPQQKSGRGYLFYECRITSTTPGVDTASSMQSKPGYFGRPWAKDTGEAVFYNTTIEKTNFSSDGKGTGSSSLITAEGWLSTLGGESALCGEYGTIDLAGASTSKRASWAQVFTKPKLADGTAIAIESYVSSSWLSKLYADGRLTATGSSSQEKTTANSSNAVSGSVKEGWYYIKNVNSNKYLEVEDNNGFAGANVCQGTGTGENGQKWYVTLCDDGYYTLKSALGSYNLDVYEWGAEDGTNIGIWDANNLDCQKFEIREVESGKYAVLTKLTNSEKGLDVYNISTEDGANVCQWSYWGGEGQIWKFESCTSSGSTTQQTTAATTQQATTQQVVTSSSKSWNFKNTGFKDLGTISSTVTVDGLGLIANSSKTMSVKSNSVTVDGTSYTYALSLGGGGNTSYRAIKVPVSGKDTIKVVLKSSGSSSRTLVVADASGNKLGTLTAGTSASVQSYSYSGNSGYVYLYSSGSNIYVYKVQVDSKSAVTEQTTVATQQQTTSTKQTTAVATQQQTTAATTSSKYMFNPSKGLTSSSYFTVSGNLSTDKGTATVNGSTISTCLKVESKTSIKFTTNSDNAVLTIYVKSKAAGGSIKINGSTKFSNIGTTVEAKSITLGSAGTYTITKGSKESYIFYVVVEDGAGSGSGSSSGSGSTTQQQTTQQQTTQQQTTASSAVSSGDIYVSPSGKSSGKGTSSDPMDIATAITKIQAGKTIWMSAGTYKLSKTIMISESNSGKSGSYKKVSSLNGGTVTLDFSSMSESGSNRGIVLDGSYWHFYDIDIKGAGDNGMLLSGDNNIIELCQFYENHDSGLQISRYNTNYTKISQWPSNNLIKNCTSYNNKDEATSENADGFAAKLTCGEGNVFDGCIAYCNSDDGWDLYAKPETGAIGVVTIKNCVAFGNGKLTDASGSANGDMNGFKLGGSGVPTAHIVTNCLAFNNGACGFTDNNNGGAIKLSNCTAANNGVYASKGNFMCYRTSSGATYTGLISYNNSASDKFLGSLKSSIYANGGKYYYTSSSSCSGSAIKSGTSVSLSSSSFKSTTLSGYNSSKGTYGTNYHSILRNSNGSVNMNGLYEYTGSYNVGAKY